MMKNIFPKKTLRLYKRSQIRPDAGFLLIELIVALFIFSLVATVSISSIIVIFDANKKAQSLQSVMNNLNLAMDTMTKALAVGTTYAPYSSGTATGLTFRDKDNVLIDFAFNTACPAAAGGSTGGCLTRRVASGPLLRLTASEIDITSASFTIHGEELFASGDAKQPRVEIFLDGVVKAGPRNQTKFALQTAVSQRIPDL